MEFLPHGSACSRRFRTGVVAQRCVGFGGGFCLSWISRLDWDRPLHVVATPANATLGRTRSWWRLSGVSFVSMETITRPHVPSNRRKNHHQEVAPQSSSAAQACLWTRKFVPIEFCTNSLLADKNRTSRALGQHRVRVVPCLSTAPPVCYPLSLERSTALTGIRTTWINIMESCCECGRAGD